MHGAVSEIEAQGRGAALAVVGDVRREEDVARAVDAAVERFGGIDVVVNSASAISLSSVADLEPRRLDLMVDVNVAAPTS